MKLKGNWLIQGYFEVSDPAGGESFTQRIRNGLATRLKQPPSSVHIKSYPVGPAWRHTFWWREGDSDNAEAQFFAQIAEEYPILSVGISVEKGLEDRENAPSVGPDSYLMQRETWDWQRLIDRSTDLIETDIPLCASLLPPISRSQVIFEPL